MKRKENMKKRKKERKILNYERKKERRILKKKHLKWL